MRPAPRPAWIGWPISSSRSKSMSDRSTSPGIRTLLVLAALTPLFLLRPAHSVDPAGTWSVKSHLPQPRGETAMTALNGKLYVLGGHALGLEATPLAEEYNPAANTWRVLAPMPRGVSHPGAAVLD